MATLPLFGPLLTFRLKASSKTVESENIRGKRKFSRAHDSLRLFCTGVPVRISLNLAFREAQLFVSAVSVFFKRCPSSRMILFHVNVVKLLRNPADLIMSYVVTTTCTFSASFIRLTMRFISEGCVACARMTLIVGLHKRNSFTQFVKTDKGTMTRKGPGCFSIVNK